MLGFTLLGQWMFHVFYGNETFLYSLHFMPLLIFVAAASMLTRARPIALVLGASLLVGEFMNNITLFQQARTMHIGTPRQSKYCPSNRFKNH